MTQPQIAEDAKRTGPTGKFQGDIGREGRGGAGGGGWCVTVLTKKVILSGWMENRLNTVIGTQVNLTIGGEKRIWSTCGDGASGMTKMQSSKLMGYVKDLRRH